MIFKKEKNNERDTWRPASPGSKKARAWTEKLRFLEITISSWNM